MLPVSRWQMPFPQNHCLTCSAATPHMGNEWRPYNGSCGPVQFHGPCNHSCFPGYYGFPPYHQMAPPAPFHWHGYRPMYPEPYPLHYVPAPYYSLEQSTPECGKIDSGNHHFCGLPNHGPNQKGDCIVKIEEPKADDGKKETESMVPAGLKDCPYPILWIPPGYMKNEENRAPVQLDRKQQGKDNATSPKSFNKSKELEPDVWKWWFPPDSKGTRSLKQSGEGNRNQQIEDTNVRLPFPMIWMPTEPVEGGRGNEHEQNNTAEKPNLSFKIIPVKLPGGDGRANATEESSGGQGGSKMMEKTTNLNIMPVREREARGEENTIKGTGEGNASKHGEDGGKDKPSDSARKQSPSSPRTAKLPPVCLRVDPLPRKKNGNSNSRSPSPPGQRRESQETPKASHSEELKGSQEATFNKSHGREPNTKDIKVVGVEEHTSRENVHNDSSSGSQNQIPTCAIARQAGGSDDPTAEKPVAAAGEHQTENDRERNAEGQIFEAIESQAAMDQSNSDDSECKILEGESGNRVEEKVSDEALKVEKNKLSDAEAAVIIQSAYRGFEVRKWEPLKKLKQLAKASEEAGVIRNRILALKSLSDYNRQRVMIGEAIMSLLLKLDAMQGLHPDLRTVRKSLAKELVSLQEELDSLMNQKLEASVVEESTAKLVENFTNDECLAGGADEEEKEATERLEISSPGDKSEKTNFTEPSQGAQMMDTSAKAKGQDTLEPMASEEEVEDKLENSTAGVQEKNDMELHAADVGPALEESKDEQGDESQDVSQAMSEPISGSGLEGTVELPFIAEKRNHDMGVAEDPLEHTNYDSNAANGIKGGEVGDVPRPINEGHLEINELEELPLGLIEEQTAMDSVPQLEKDDKIEIGNVKVQEGCQIGGKETNDVTIADDGAPKVNDQEQQPVDENPEDKAAAPAVIESKNDGNIEAAEAEVSEGSQEEWDEAATTTSLNDEAPGMNQSEEQLTKAETEGRAELQKERASQTDEPQPVVPFVEKEEDKGAANVEDAKDDPPKKAIPIENTEGSLEEAYEESKTARVEAPGTESCGGAIDNQVVIHDTGDEADEKLIEENRKLREMMEQMMNAGKEQLTVISNLTRRVKNLERELSRKKNLRSRRRHRASPPCSIPVTP